MLPLLLHHLLELDLKWCDDHNLAPCRVAWKVKSEHYPDLGSDASSVWNFQRSFLRPHFAGKPVLMSRNVGYFLRLEMPVPRILLNIIFYLDTASEEQSALKSQSERQLPALVDSRTRHLESLQSWAIIHEGYCLLYSRLLKEAAAHVDQVNQAV